MMYFKKLTSGILEASQSKICRVGQQARDQGRTVAAVQNGRDQPRGHSAGQSMAERPRKGQGQRTSAHRMQQLEGTKKITLIMTWIMTSESTMLGKNDKKQKEI